MVETKSRIGNISNKTSKPSLKSIIRKYLMEDCFIIKDIKEKRYDFGFDIKYPKSFDKEGNQIGRILTILKPKGKNLLRIISKIMLDNEGLDIFNKFDDIKKNALKTDLMGYLINQNLLQSIDLVNNRIVFLDKIYFTSSNLPNINDVYHSIIKIVNTQIIVMNILTVRLGVKDKVNTRAEFDASYFK